MNTMKRALTTLGLAGATLAITGTAHAAGVLGFGDNGGLNTDESASLLVLGDSFMSGQSNTFAPITTIAGIDGVGSSYVR
ncbi:hypothetical protein [Streptomyces sp. 8N706]|uniref:hypothetical protein n=1 Tax=Streptomyces sp. 8N706 TaxID=3457416 RepID=UPI003FD3DAA4